MHACSLPEYFHPCCCLSCLHHHAAAWTCPLCRHTRPVRHPLAASAPLHLVPIRRRREQCQVLCTAIEQEQECEHVDKPVDNPQSAALRAVSSAGGQHSPLDPMEQSTPLDTDSQAEVLPVVASTPATINRAIKRCGANTFAACVCYSHLPLTNAAARHILTSCESAQPLLFPCAHRCSTMVELRAVIEQEAHSFNHINIACGLVRYSGRCFSVSVPVSASFLFFLSSGLASAWL